MSKTIWRQTWVKGVGEQIFFIKIILYNFLYSKVELTSSFPFVKQDDLWCVWNSGFSPSCPPQLDFCVKVKCAMLGVSFWVCVPSLKNIKVYSGCRSHVLNHCMSPILLDLLPERINNQEYPKVHTLLTTCSCFLLISKGFIIIIIKIIFFMIIWGISRQCFVYGHKLDLGNFILQLSMVV